MQALKFESIVRRTAASFDASGVFSRPTTAAVQNNLVQASLSVTAKEYLSFSLLSSLVSGLSAFFALLFLGTPPAQSFALSLLFFALLFLCLFKLPAVLKKRRAEVIERDLAIALRAIAVDISLNTPFEKALRNVASSRYEELSRETSRALRDVESSGLSVPDALRQMASRVDSLVVKRACMQLCFTYEHGLKGEGLRKLADELASLQKAKSRQYSAQLSLFGLLFITLSCIVPALFSAYVVVGSAFLELSFTPSDVFFAYVLVFPALDSLVLLYLYSRSPMILTA